MFHRVSNAPVLYFATGVDTPASQDRSHLQQSIQQHHYICETDFCYLVQSCQTLCLLEDHRIRLSFYQTSKQILVPRKSLKTAGLLCRSLLVAWCEVLVTAHSQTRHPVLFQHSFLLLVEKDPRIAQRIAAHSNIVLSIWCLDTTCLCRLV